MVYTGYFWDLTYNEDANVLAIFEFQTMKPDEQLLVDLFSFLINKGLKILLITPFVYEYTIDVALEDLVEDMTYYDSMYCNINEYSLFLRHSFKSMINNFGGFQDNTTLLVDGRYAGITSSLTEYNLGELCYNAPTLRRIINYISFGYTTDDELIFEEELFRDLWQLYYETFFAQFESELPDYFSDSSVPLADFYNVWLDMKQEQGSFSESDIAQYTQNYAMAFEEYYTDLAEQLRNNNIHVLLNVDDNKYVDVLSASPSELIINNYSDVFNATPGIDHLFALAIWPWASDYRSLLGNIYYNLSTIQNTYSSDITHFPVYLWSDEEIPLTEDGLPVITLEDMREENVYPKVDEELLESEFIRKVLALLYAE